MSEKPEPVRGWGHQLAEGGLCDRCFAPADKRELIQHGKAIPVAIVPMPENGEVREMWEWQVNRLQTEIVTRARRDAILEEPSHTWSVADFRPVTVIDREVRE